MAIPEKVSELIGKPLGGIQIFEVERGAIRRFADAVDDPNPLYHDIEYAKNSKYGEMIAPLGFRGWPLKGGLMEMMGSVIGPMMNAGYPVILDAGVEFESSIPIRAGDSLACYPTITNIAEKTTKSGKGMLILTVETHCLNQNGDKALVERASIICREL